MTKQKELKGKLHVQETKILQNNGSGYIIIPLIHDQIQKGELTIRTTLYICMYLCRQLFTNEHIKSVFFILFIVEIAKIF